MTGSATDLSAVRFLDSSFLAAAYLSDERGHGPSAKLLAGSESLIASELVLTEVSSAIAAAQRSGRLSAGEVSAKLKALEFDVGPRGRIDLLPLDGPTALARARELVLRHPVRTLDALHLAVAERQGRALGAENTVFTTHDRRQRSVAAGLGLNVG